MTLELTKIFFDECSKAFGFLVTEHGFKPPTLEVNRLIHFATVTFMAPTLLWNAFLMSAKLGLNSRWLVSSMVRKHRTMPSIKLEIGGERGSVRGSGVRAYY